MSIEIKVPAMGESVSEATVAGWFNMESDAVARDEPLLELETDKVTVEVPAPASGAHRIHHRESGRHGRRSARSSGRHRRRQGRHAVDGRREQSRLPQRPKPAPAPKPAAASNAGRDTRGARRRKRMPSR